MEECIHGYAGDEINREQEPEPPHGPNARYTSMTLCIGVALARCSNAYLKDPRSIVANRRALKLICGSQHLRLGEGRNDDVREDQNDFADVRGPLFGAALTLLLGD